MKKISFALTAFEPGICMGEGVPLKKKKRKKKNLPEILKEGPSVDV